MSDIQFEAIAQGIVGFTYALVIWLVYKGVKEIITNLFKR